MAQGSARADAGRVLLVGGSLFLLGFLILATAAIDERLDGVDGVARALVHQSRHPGLQTFMEGASFLGGQPGQVAIVVIASVLLWPRRRRWAMGLPFAMLGVGIVQLLAKWAIDRPRPNLGVWGFPSAHVLSLVVVCGYLAYVVSITSRRKRWRALAMGAGAGVVATVAYSRMYLDAHWLSDVLGGLAAGLAYLLIVIWVIDAAPRLRRALRARPLANAAETLLVPAVAGPSADPLVAAAAAVAMTPATPAADAS